MKKYLVFIIGLLTCFSLTVSTVSADDELKDNSLQIDSSRLEENKTTDVSSSLDLTKNLFSNGDRALLEKNQENVANDFKEQQDQLFTQETIATDDSQVEALFSSETAVGQYTTKVNTSVDTTSQTSNVSGLLAIFYGVASLLLICGASFATYVVSRGEE